MDLKYWAPPSGASGGWRPARRMAAVWGLGTERGSFACGGQAEVSHLRQERQSLQDRLAAGERERQSLERDLQAEQRKVSAALSPKPWQRKCCRALGTALAAQGERSTGSAGCAESP